MNTTIKTACCILVLAVSATAANYAVKSSGGGDFSSIQACASAMSAGDTCTIFAGTYNENVNVGAGSAGNYKTVTVNPGDTVFVRSFTISSHVKVNGFHIQNPSSPTSAPCVSVSGNSTDYFVTNNNMYACDQAVHEPDNANTTHGVIQGNTISYTCSTSSAPNVCRAMTINGDYHLIERNDISHVSDGPYIFGRHNVLRKNTFHDVSSSDCGSNSSNCHIDFLQFDAGVPTNQPSGYVLIESNTVRNMTGGNMHAVGLFQGEVCSGQCFNAIVRFHTAYSWGGSGVVNDNSTSACPAWDNVKVYNNTWVDGGGSGGIINNTSYCSTGSAYLNDIYYWSGSVSNLNAYSTVGGGGSSTAPYTVGHNLAYCPGCTASSVHPHTYGNGSWTDDSGNIVANPLFASYSGHNFALNSGSPAIGAGSYLTRASGSGSNSTSLTVADADYFQDGSGIPGVQADWIRIGANTTVQISSVNYSTNVITLADPVNWNSNDPIYLYKISDGTQVLSGANPDLGAFPSTGSVAQGSAPAPPTGLAAVVQ